MLEGSTVNASEATTVNASEADLLDCQFHKWFELFKSNTMKSSIINLPDEFITYLLQDGVILPSSESGAFGRDELSDDEDLTEREGDVQLAREDFSQLSADIKTAIVQLRGEVFPKFNWSAPTDASWLRGGSLKCNDAADVYLLLKSSDRIVFDIENMFNLCPDSELKRPHIYTLVLRKWANLDPAMEFRVFIGENHVLGISQRDCSSYYDFLAREKDDLEDKIIEFWEEKVRGKFLLNKYSLDVFIDRKKRVWIVDFNPFGEPSSSLLFEWYELQNLSISLSAKKNVEITIEGVDKKDDNDINAGAPPIDVSPIQETEIDFEFRIINNQNETFSSAAGSSRGPIDVTLAPDFHKFMEICKNQDKEERSKNEENSAM